MSDELINISNNTVPYVIKFFKVFQILLTFYMIFISIYYIISPKKTYKTTLIVLCQLIVGVLLFFILKRFDLLPIPSPFNLEFDLSISKWYEHIITMNNIALDLLAKSFNFYLGYLLFYALKFYSHDLKTDNINYCLLWQGIIAFSLFFILNIFNLFELNWYIFIYGIVFMPLTFLINLISKKLAKT
jgi:hypothetical protein